MASQTDFRERGVPEHPLDLKVASVESGGISATGCSRTSASLESDESRVGRLFGNGMFAKIALSAVITGANYGRSVNYGSCDVLFVVVSLM